MNNWILENIEFISEKISEIVGILYRLRNILAFHFKKLIYFSLIHSHISYDCEIWSHVSVSWNGNLFVLQKKAFKVMCGLSFRAHSYPFFCRNSIFPLKLFINYRSCLYIHTNRLLVLSSTVHHHLFRNDSIRNGCRSILYWSTISYYDFLCLGK
jgi:hypothetical protein